MAQIERWEDHLLLKNGQLIQDGTGEIFQVYRRHDESDETWLCHFSDEYGVIMGPRGFHDHGGGFKFPLTTMKAVPDDE
jgi:hypothetical protein